MQEKRFRKFKSMVRDLPPVEIVGDEDADIGFATWGSPVGAIIEAMELARAEHGIKTKLIKSVMIHPQPEAAFQQFFDSCKTIIIPEKNYQGQYAALLKARYGIRPIEMHLPAARPVSPAMVVEKIKEVHRALTHETVCA
jgi:2-oxoglutarate ferredoxin oxidoreductase subunit alpha